MKRNIKLAAAVVLLAALAAGTASAAPMTLDMDTAVDLALENNPDFLLEGIDLGTAEREDSTSWNVFLPSLSAGAGLSGGSNLFDAQANNMSWSVNASLSMSMSLSASLAYQIKALQLAYEAQEISYEAARESLVASVEKEFYYLLAVRENISIEQANIDLAKARYDQTKTNFDNGLASELELLQAQVTAANLEPDYLQTVSDYNARVREFLIILGLDPQTEIELDGSLDTTETSFNAEELISLYLNERSDIQTLQKSLEIAQNSKSNTAAGSRTPSVSLSTGWSTSVGDAFNAGSWNYNTWTDGFSLGVNLNIPLDSYIPGSSDAVQIKGAEDEVEKASIELAKAVEEARTEIINLVEQLETTASAMDLSTLNVELAKKTYELSEESYSRGTVQRLDVEDAQQSYLEAVQSSLESKYEYLAALIDLRTALGLESLDELM